jgi:predicted Rossmann fold nucleotide-binding protein DprA/Smf involved in DNA uptake
MKLLKFTKWNLPFKNSDLKSEHISLLHVILLDFIHLLISEFMNAFNIQISPFPTRRKLSFSLGQHTTVFQAEVYAIKACISQNIDRGYKN